MRLSDRDSKFVHNFFHLFILILYFFCNLPDSLVVSHPDPGLFLFCCFNGLVYWGRQDIRNVQRSFLIWNKFSNFKHKFMSLRFWKLIDINLTVVNNWLSSVLQAVPVNHLKVDSVDYKPKSTWSQILRYDEWWSVPMRGSKSPNTLYILIRDWERSLVSFILPTVSWLLAIASISTIQILFDFRVS